MLSKCCEGCSSLVREKCEKAHEKYTENGELNRFIHCNTQNIRLLIEVAT